MWRTPGTLEEKYWLRCIAMFSGVCLITENIGNTVSLFWFGLSYKGESKMNLKNTNMAHVSVAENVTIIKINFKLMWTHLDTGTYHQRKNQKVMKNILKKYTKNALLSIEAVIEVTRISKCLTTDLNENLDFFFLSVQRKSHGFLNLC